MKIGMTCERSGLGPRATSKYDSIRSVNLAIGLRPYLSIVISFSYKHYFIFVKINKGVVRYYNSLGLKTEAFMLPKRSRNGGNGCFQHY